MDDFPADEFRCTTRPPHMSTFVTDDFLHDPDVIELEPTMALDLADPEAAAAFAGRQPAAVAMAQGTMASLVGETDSLRRGRLLAAAVFLAASFGLLTVWIFASDNPGTLSAEGSYFSLRFMLLAARCLLSTAVAGLLASEAPLTGKQLRVVEYVLFLGITAFLMLSQYFVGLDLMSRGPDYAAITLAFMKDGVIQMLVLMMIYGTLIPNSPWVAARLLAVMFIGPVVGGVVLPQQP